MAQSNLKIQQFRANDIVDNVKLKKLLDEKFLIYSNNHIRLSVKGFYLLDAIIREIIK